MALADAAPFLVVLLLGGAAGRLVASRPRAWALASFVPALHLTLSVLTGRASDDLFAYVLPVNVLLLAVAILGLVAGRWLRGHGAT